MEDRAPEVWTVAILFLVLSWIAVCLRVYVRACMLKSFGLDDWTMLATLFLFTIYVSCQMGGLAHGTGKHVWDMTRENNTIALRFWYFCEIFYILSTSMLKVSIGIFLLRVAVKPIHVWIIRLIMVGTCLFGTMYLFVAMLQCRPVADFWNKNPSADTCLTSNVIVGCTYAAGVLVSASDWTFGILPGFIVWDLKMTVRSKIIVAAILALAAIGSTATIVRIPYAHTLSHGDDFLWATTDIALWSTVEPGIGITAGCIATLRPLLQLLLYKTGLISTAPASSRQLDSKYGKSNSRLRSGYLRNGSQVDAEFGNREDTSGAVKMTTTITGAHGDREKRNPNKSWTRGSNESEEEIVKGGGINREIRVEYEYQDAELRLPDRNNSHDELNNSRHPRINSL